MLLIFILLILVVTAIAIIAKRQTRSDQLEDRSPKYLNDENLRPLFAPDEEELRAFASEERDLAQAREKEEEDLRIEETLASFHEFRQNWRESANRTNTIELIRRASEIRGGSVYLETVSEVLKRHPSDSLSDGELAQLIESHFRLLPLDERTPGAVFTINQEVSELRRSSKKVGR